MVVFFFPIFEASRLAMLDFSGAGGDVWRCFFREPKAVVKNGYFSDFLGVRLLYSGPSPRMSSSENRTDFSSSEGVVSSEKRTCF